MESHLILSQFSLEWKLQYENESAIISKILQKNLLDIHHIGSTSIPGMTAKPVIDILPVVSSLLEVDQVRLKFEENLFEYKGEFGIKNRRYLVGYLPDSKTHRVHIHIFQKGDREIGRHLFFRDYLRSNPDRAKEYMNLKLELFAKFEFDRKKYQEGKNDFCEKILKDVKI